MNEENTIIEEEGKPKQDKMDRRPAIPNLPPDRPGLNIEMMRTVCGNFSRKVFGSPEMAEKVKASGLIIRFLYYDELWGDEEVWVTINCRAEPVDIQVGAAGSSDVEPDVAMKMHADLAHKFWMQKLNLTMAVARGWTPVKGAIPKMMRLIPFIRPGYALYKETLAELELVDLLNYPPDKKPEVQQDASEQQTEPQP